MKDRLTKCILLLLAVNVYSGSCIDSIGYPYDQIKNIMISTRIAPPPVDFKKPDTSICYSNASLVGNFEGVITTTIWDYDTCFWKDLFLKNKVEQEENYLVGAFMCGEPSFEITFKIKNKSNTIFTGRTTSITPSVIAFYHEKKHMRWVIHLNNTFKEQFKNKIESILEYGISQIKKSANGGCP